MLAVPTCDLRHTRDGWDASPYKAPPRRTAPDSKTDSLGFYQLVACRRKPLYRRLQTAVSKSGQGKPQGERHETRQQAERPFTTYHGRGGPDCLGTAGLDASRTQCVCWACTVFLIACTKRRQLDESSRFRRKHGH